jgi:hypothetical protein
MKAPALLLLALPLTAISNPPAFLPDFKERLDRLPSLSLGEISRQGPLTLRSPEVREVAARPGPPVAPRSPRFVSRMPVIEPDPAVDPRMPVKTPDPNVDYKLNVREPDVASGK